MNLNIIPNGAIKRVHVSQNDVGRTLTFELFNNSTSYTVPIGATVKIQGTKPSGFGFSETCTVNGNVVTVDTTETMTDEHGYIDTELSISYSGNKIGTSNFILAVEKNPHPDTTTDGSMETIIPELTLLVNEVKSYAEEIEGTYHAYGSPWVASTVAQMTDTDKIYVYTGSETGYVNGNWYYYNGTAWVSGGVYNAVAVNTDKTLTQNGVPADAEAVGDFIDDALSPTITKSNLCQGIERGKNWVAWNNGDTVVLSDNANYMAATVVLDGAEHITLNRGWDGNSFSFFADANKKRVALMRDCIYNNINYVYTVPSNAVYAYISQNIVNPPYNTEIDTYGVVVLEGTTSIDTLYTISDYPYGGTSETNYHADNLYMTSVSEQKLSDILPPIVELPDVVIQSTDTIYSKTGLSDFNDATDNSLITVLIPASTLPSDLPANYPVGHVIKGVGQLTTYVSSNGQVKVQTYRNAVQGLTYTRQYTVGTGWQAWYPMNVKKRYTCLKNGSGNFSSLVTAINTLSEEMDVELFVGPGTWNIIDELGSDYMDAVTSSPSTWGLELKNRIHVICSSDSVITAKYTGSNSNVTTYFSAFNAGEYGFTLENANIETDNIRYTIHDDRGAGGYEGYTNRYINCSMKHTNGMYSDCIGGGLGRNGLIEIKNCYFEGDPTDSRLVYYHGNNYSGQTDAQCKIIVTGNYFANLGTFGLTKYGDSTKVSTAYVSNNSVGSALFVNSGSYAPQDNMQMIAWNNEIRS